jgi:CDP-4-dehydro-6-deoxyglucose reductase, E1
VGGVPDWDAIVEIAQRHDLAIIEDSADTIGATLRGRPTGTRSLISTTSFYGSHIMNCAGNGGALCVDSPELAQRALLLRSWGRRSSLSSDHPAELDARFRADIDGIPYDAKFIFDEIGYNFEPSEVGSAFGLVQLDRLEQNMRGRIRNYAIQYEFFREFEEWFVLPRQLPESMTAWLAFPLTIRESAPFTRTQLQLFLERRNIQTRPVLAGNIIRQPGFRNMTMRTTAEGYPVADDVTRGGILFALHHGLTPEQIEHVHSSFRAFVAQL